MGKGFSSGVGTSIETTEITDDAVTLAKMAAGTDGNLITYDANGDPAAVATGTAGQVLTSNGVGAAPTFQAAGSGAVTRAGGNTVEATTASLTAVSLLTTTSLSIGASVPIQVFAQLRKTTGAAASASAGVMINATTVFTSAAFTGTDNAAESGSARWSGQSAQTNYDRGGVGFMGSNSLGVLTNLIGSPAFPVATITDIIVLGLVGSASITMGADEMHVYTYAVS